MKLLSRAIHSRLARSVATAGLLFAALVFTACEPAKPLSEFRSQQDAGDFAQTVEPLRVYLKRHPDDPEANYLYGRALARTQGSNLAMWSLRKAMKDPEWLVPSAMQLAFMALAAGDYNEVIQLTARIHEVEPDNVKAFLIRANAYAHWKKAPELALADAQQVLELDPNVVEAYEPLILALLDLERFDEAADALEEAGEKVRELGTTDKVLAWHCATTAVFQQERNELDAARETWESCLEAYPSNLDIVMSGMEFFDSRGDLARSLQILQDALDATPDSRPLRISLAQRLSAYGDAAGAESLLRAATETSDPAEAAAAWLDLAKLRQGLGEHASAVAAWQQAVEFATAAGDPTPQLLFEYADALVLAEQYDRALTVAESLSVPVHGHLIRGRVAQERAQPTLAMEEFDAALLLWPDNPWARYYAALVAEELGRFDRALEEYRYSIRISPEATDARSRLATLLYAEGKPTFAMQMLQTGGSGGGPPEVEGQILFLHLQGMRNDSAAILEQLIHLEASHSESVGKGLAAAAEGLRLRSGPAVAIAMLASAPGVDYGQTRYAPALRLLIEYSHEAGRTEDVSEVLRKIVEVRSDQAIFHELNAYNLELTGARSELVRKAYERAVELDAANGLALAGLARLTAARNPSKALDYYDLALAADGSLVDVAVRSSELLVQLGRSDEARTRLDAFLRSHPFEAKIAMAQVEIDLATEAVTVETLERATRAVRFRGGADALDQLSQVHAAMGEADRAAQASEQALRLREAIAAREAIEPIHSAKSQ